MDEHCQNPIYQQLPTSRHIRLLTLHPAQLFNDEISCELVPVSIDSTLSFEALSYVWGSPPGAKQICMCGTPFNIGVNLHSALQNLRLNDRPRILWADALCINQTDLTERAEQVKLMGDIYSTSLKTLIWLGEETDDVRGALTALRTARATFPSGPVWDYDSSTPAISEYLHQVIKGSDPLCDFDWRPLANLLLRPWFRRKWVIQEVVVARNSIIVLGKDTAPFMFLNDLLKLMNMVGLSDRIMKQTHSTYAYTIAASNLVKIAALASDREGNPQTLRDPLLWAVGSLGTFDCSDPRDHLIALLGIISDASPNDPYLAPNYATPYRDTIYRWVQWHLEKLQSLDFLCLAAYMKDQDSASAERFPSWFPDLRRREALDVLKWRDPQDYSHHIATRPHSLSTFDHPDNATRQSGIPVAEVLHNGSVLRVRGRLVDAVEKLASTVYSDSPDHDWAAADEVSQRYWELLSWVHTAQWFRECQAMGIGLQHADGTALEASEVTGNHVLADLCQAMLFIEAINETGDQRIGADFITYSAWCREIATDDWQAAQARFVDPNFQQVHQRLMRKFDSFGRRRLARTKKLCFGWMPFRAQEGDKIWLLEGMVVPALLRPVTGDCPESLRSKFPQYEVVGDCHVLPYMNPLESRLQRILTETVDLV